VVRSLAEGNSIRATARIMGIDKDTVYRIFERASEHCHKVVQELLVDPHLEECHLDELWSSVKKGEQSHPFREDPYPGW
jgi:hypothetical protein